MALIATPGAPDANSYIAVADATEYFKTAYNRTAWANAGNGDKEKALIEATRLLDMFVKWYGTIATDSQALRWPRTSAYDQDYRELSSSDIPRGIKNITCELAYNILNNSGFDISENSIDRIKVGPLDINFDVQQRSNGFTKIVRDAIAFWGELILPSSSGVGTPKLVRT